MITICCVCKKIKCRDGWKKQPQIEDNEYLSHGYCPGCYTEMMENFFKSSFGKEIGIDWESRKKSEEFPDGRQPR
ncbi:MAG: hypothetical protein KAR13_18935 [Desulfobulbaceae bacterium]|nr:hypothetical protein [Desulfobulbaceae bacterium]MCK5322781.1 hypothetical protein [Desulfobulbaceae bacterium]MCK5437149.1 hypothetical protein [Desulfobulbaceae bacterium]MCK5544030.1 hypothetical protein [Desulfobulbaceae bacterium]